MNRITGLLAASLCLVLLVACASHPKKIDCEGRLSPINLPAPASDPKDSRS